MDKKEFVLKAVADKRALIVDVSDKIFGYAEVGFHEFRTAKLYEEVRKKEPGNQALRMSMLDYYKQTGQDSLYQTQLDAILYGKETDERARVMLMRNYIVDQENAHADSTLVLAVFDRIFDSVPETVDMLTLYASYLQMKHINDQLEPALERILKLEPDNQVALYQLVQLAVHANDYPKVADICTRAIMHYPEQLPY